MYKGNPNLPDPPVLKRFKTYDEFEEALGFWKSRIKMLGMKGVTEGSETAPSVDSPESESAK